MLCLTGVAPDPAKIIPPRCPDILITTYSTVQYGERFVLPSLHFTAGLSSRRLLCRRPCFPLADQQYCRAVPTAADPHFEEVSLSLRDAYIANAAPTHLRSHTLIDPAAMASGYMDGEHSQETSYRQPDGFAPTSAPGHGNPDFDQVLLSDVSRHPEHEHPSSPPLTHATDRSDYPP